MTYLVRVIPSAERELDRLPTAIHNRLSNKILSLEKNPRPRGIKKLSGSDEYRLRVGDYRVLYTINDKNQVVTIVAVRHRREAYR